MRKNKIAKSLASFLVVVMLLTMVTAFASNRPIDLVTGNGSPFEDGTRTNLLCFEAEPGKDAGIPISLCQKKFANFPAEGVVLNENDLIQYDIYADLLLPEGKEPNSNNFVVGGLDGTISDGTHSSAMRDFLNGTLPLWDATISSNFNGSIDTSIPYRQWKTVTVVVTGSGNGTRLTNVGPGVFAVKNSSTTDVLKYILYFDNVRIVRNGATLISLYDGEDTCNLDYFGQEYNSGGYRNYISSAGSTKLQDNFATGNIATPSGDFIALKAKSNADGSYINKALFAKVSDQSVNVASGDYISYDVYIDTQIRGVLGEGGNIYYCNTGVGGLAVKDTNGNWKGNSNIDLSSSYMKWSRQKYTFTEAATCNDWCVAINGPFQNNTEITALYDNIILYNADGSIKKVIWQDGPFIEPSSVSSPATADVKFTWSVDVYNDQGAIKDLAIDLSSYNVSEKNIITKVAENTTIADFRTSLNPVNGVDLVITNKYNQASLFVGTGTTITVNDQSLFTIVIYGDVSGNGKVDLDDLVLIRDHILGAQLIEGANALAADLYSEKAVTLNDLVGVMAQISACPKGWCSMRSCATTLNGARATAAPSAPPQS